MAILRRASERSSRRSTEKSSRYRPEVCARTANARGSLRQDGQAERSCSRKRKNHVPLRRPGAGRLHRGRFLEVWIQRSVAKLAGWSDRNFQAQLRLFLQYRRGLYAHGRKGKGFRMAAESV